MFLAAGGEISVQLPTVREARAKGMRIFTLGDGGPPVRVSAGGSVSVATEDAGSDLAAAADVDEKSTVLRLLEHGRIAPDDARALLLALGEGAGAALRE
jgi:hypothetical protein